MVRMDSLQATFHGVEGITLAGVIGDLEALQDLLFVGAVAQMGSLEERPDGRGIELIVKTGAIDTVVQRVSYNSPLEIWLEYGQLLGAGGGGLVTMGSGAILLFRKYQQARKEKAEADSYVLAHDLIQESLRHQRDVVRRRKLEIGGAAHALVGLDALEITAGSGKKKGKKRKKGKKGKKAAKGKWTNPQSYDY